jgi:hypothetical protein
VPLRRLTPPIRRRASTRRTVCSETPSA